MIGFALVGLVLAAPDVTLCAASDLDAAEVARAVTLELAATSSVQVEIDDCRAGLGAVEVRVRGASTELDLHRLSPEARPRALALAAAELLRIPRYAEQRRWTFGLAGRTRFVPRSSTFMGGGAVYARFDGWGTRFRPLAGARFLYGARRLDLGRASLFEAAAGVGAAFVVFEAPVAFELEARADLGVARAWGVSRGSALASNGTRVVQTVSAGGAAVFPLGDTLGLRLLVHGGIVTRGIAVRADGALVLGLDGPFVGVDVQIVYAMTGAP